MRILDERPDEVYVATPEGPAPGTWVPRASLTPDAPAQSEEPELAPEPPKRKTK